MTSWKPGNIREVRYRLRECDGAIDRARYWLNIGDSLKAQQEINNAISQKHEAMREFPYPDPDGELTFEDLYEVFYWKDRMMVMAQAVAEFIAGTSGRPSPDYLTIPEIIARLDDITQRAVDLAQSGLFEDACLAHLNQYIAEMRNFKQYLQQANPPLLDDLAELAGKIMMHESNFFACVYGSEVRAGTCYGYFSGMDYWLFSAYLALRHFPFDTAGDIYPVLVMLNEAEALKHELLHNHIPRLTDGTDPYPPHDHDPGEGDLPPIPPNYASARRGGKTSTAKKTVKGKKKKMSSPRKRGSKA